MMTCFSHLILWTLSYLSSTEKVNHKHDKHSRHAIREHWLCWAPHALHRIFVKSSVVNIPSSSGLALPHKSSASASVSFIEPLVCQFDQDLFLRLSAVYYRDETHYRFLGNSPGLIFKFSEGISDFWLPVINSLHPPEWNRIYLGQTKLLKI